MAEKRSKFFLFINTDPKGTTPVYALVGEGVTTLTVSYNPQTTTDQYIHQDTANTEITGYQPNAPVESRVVPGDAAFDFINEMRKDLPLMSDSYTDVVLVDIFSPITGSTGTYESQKQNVSIQIDSYGGAASDPLSVGYTINWRGDGIPGEFDTASKTFTAI